MLKIETKLKILHIMDRADFGNASCTSLHVHIKQCHRRCFMKPG